MVRQVALLAGTLLLTSAALKGAKSPAVNVSENYANLPLQFEPNRGQTATDARFIARGRGYALFLMDNEAVFASRKGERNSVIRMRMRGANPHPRAEAAGLLPGVSNYFIGKDPRQWRTNVPTFRSVQYHEVWPGIDMAYYGNQARLEYDFVVHPGADPRQIRLQFSGFEDLRVDPNGDLVMRTPEGEARHRKPLVYMETAGGRRYISGRYVVRGREVGFEVPSYDARYPLVIDPTFLYSTFLGGNDNDWASGIALDGQGNAYITGYTWSTNFPLVNPAYTSKSTNTDIFVAKLSATGTALLYSTYVGGADWDSGYGIAVDPSGNAYVGGSTRSTDFPMMNAVQSTNAGGSDVVAFKLNPAGNQLLYSTYLGGTGDDAAYGIAVDAFGSAYLVGDTNSTNLPVVSAAQNTLAGYYDAFVLKLTTAGAKVYATYLGGSDWDSGRAIAVDTSGNAYVTGFTYSTAFPTTSGAYSITNQGASDVFVTEVNSDGTAWKVSTYVGGSSSEGGYGIAVDSTGVYVSGDTWSTDFPGTGAGAQNHLAGANDAVVFKLNLAGSGLLWATYLGGSRSEQASGVAVDSGGNVYVTGFTFSSGFPAVNALQTTKIGISDPLYKSGDAAGTWSPVAAVSVTNPSLLKVSPASASTLFLVDCSTLYRSTDSGATWVVAGGVPTGTGCAQSLAIDGTNPAVIYLGVPNGVEKSLDGGITWNSAGAGLPSTSVYSLAIDAGNSAIIYAATSSGLFKSVNGGGNWSQLAGLPTDNIISVAAHPTLANVVFAAPNNYCSIYRSADAGATWTSQNLNGCSISTISFSAANPNVGYLASGTYVGKTADAGVTWTAAALLPVCCTRNLAADPNNSNALYVGAGTGIYKSTDGANTWNPASGSIFTLNPPNLLAVAPTNPATIYATATLNQSGFVAKLNSSGSSLLYSTYLQGGGGTTAGTGIATDNAGAALVTGYTTDGGFPSTLGSFQPAKASYTDAYIVRIGDATPGCTFAFSPSERTYNSLGTAQDSFIVLAPSGCGWSISTTASWIHLMDGIAGAGLSNAGTGTVFFSVDGNSGTSSRTGTITIGGQSLTITQTPPALLGIAMAHIGNFSQGQLGVTYTVTVSNSAGAGPSSGYVYVADSQPSGLTVLSMAGTGWTCPSAAYCYRYDVLNPGASYPPITVTANVASNAPSPLTNTSYVSGGGSSGTVYAYDSATVTVVAPYLISTLAGGNIPPTSAMALSYPLTSITAAVADSVGNVFIGSALGCVFKVDFTGALTRYAGTCRSGYSGDGGPAVNAQLNEPLALAVDARGTLYIADSNNYRIRKVTAAGIITTAAGTGTAGYSGDGGPATSAALTYPYGLAIDTAGNLYVGLYNYVRKISAAGVISTVAGNGGYGYSGDGGPATSAQLYGAMALAADSTGNLYIADSYNYRVRKVSATGIITTVAGTGTAGYSGDGGPAINAQLSYNRGLGVDFAGNLYIGDSNNYRVRTVSTTGTITTAAGNGSCCDSGDGGPAGGAAIYVSNVSVDSNNNLYIADSADGLIRKVSTGGSITTVAGGGVQSQGDGSLAAAGSLSYPDGVAVDPDGNIYIADANNSRVRKVTPGGVITTVAGNGLCCYSGDGGPATAASISAYSLAFDSAGYLYIGGYGSVRKVSSGGTITTVAGNGTPGFSGDGGLATNARLSYAYGLAVSGGNVYLSDTFNYRVRNVSSDGKINTVAGNGTSGYSGDGGLGVNAELGPPYGLVADASGSVYIADSSNYRVRKLAVDGTITTVAGTGSYGNSGDGGLATSAQLKSPYGLAADTAGNLYIGDYGDNTVRRISTAGIIATLAGTGAYGYSGDGGPAVTAQLGQPAGVALDSSGRIYVADSGNKAVRVIQASGSQAVFTVTKSHTGNFTQAQSGATYTITVSNSALAGASAGTFSVTENPPSGLTVVSMSGSGWSCSGNSCSRSNSLAAGASYPPITVMTALASTTRLQVTNQIVSSGGGAFAVAAGDSAFVTPPPLRFVAMRPCRIADTRTAGGPFGGPQISGGTSRDFVIPDSACGVPATAQAYSLNVAVVPAGSLGYLTLWPSGQPQPLASNLNSLDGRIKSNAVILPAGTAGAIRVFASNSTDVVLDIDGYFVPASDPTALAFYPLTPCRIADTRKPTAPLGGPSMPGGQSRTFPVLSASTCNIPASAQAYSLNFAVVPAGSLGYLTVWPTGQTKPLVSTLNALTGTITANGAIVPAGTSGSIDVFASDATNLVIDINGYFAPMTTGGLSLYNVTPCRILDTRKPAGSLPFTGAMDVDVTANPCGVPTGSKAYVLSTTVVPPGSLGYLTLWPRGQGQPVVSTLNALDGAITSNLALVPTNDGSISVFASSLTHLVLDIFGYFAQ